MDGTGADPVLGDLAIKDGMIAAMGQVEGQAREVIDATGHTVTPGFIDTHTHLDAQIGWDPDMTPVSWHGVTTALIGNCGVTFAPCKPADREFLASMMETVEDIPREAILSGLGRPPSCKHQPVCGLDEKRNADWMRKGMLGNSRFALPSGGPVATP